GRPSNRHGMSVADRRTMETRSAFNAIGLIEQLTDGDLRFARVPLPLSDCVGDGIIELEQSFVYRRERGDSPKTFCPTEDRPSSARRSTIGIMLKNRQAILHDEHGHAGVALGIF